MARNDYVVRGFKKQILWRGFFLGFVTRHKDTVFFCFPISTKNQWKYPVLLWPLFHDVTVENYNFTTESFGNFTRTLPPPARITQNNAVNVLPVVCVPVFKCARVCVCACVCMNVRACLSVIVTDGGNYIFRLVTRYFMNALKTIYLRRADGGK